MGIPECYLLPGKRSNLRRTQVLLLSQLWYEMHVNFSIQTLIKPTPQERTQNIILSRNLEKDIQKHPQPKCIQFALYERKKKETTMDLPEKPTQRRTSSTSPKYLDTMSHKKTQSEKGRNEKQPRHRTSFQGGKRSLLWYPVRPDISSLGRDERMELGHEDDCCGSDIVRLV